MEPKLSMDTGELDGTIVQCLIPRSIIKTTGITREQFVKCAQELLTKNHPEHKRHRIHSEQLYNYTNPRIKTSLLLYVYIDNADEAVGETLRTACLQLIHKEKS